MYGTFYSTFRPQMLDQGKLGFNWYRLMWYNVFSGDPVILLFVFVQIFILLILLYKSTCHNQEPKNWNISVRVIWCQCNIIHLHLWVIRQITWIWSHAVVCDPTELSKRFPVHSTITTKPGHGYHRDFNLVLNAHILDNSLHRTF